MRHAMSRAAQTGRCWWLLAAVIGACGESSDRTTPGTVSPSDGGGSTDDGATGGSDRTAMPLSPTLGLTCGGACTNPFCVSADPGTCGGTSLTQPCVGRASGMYCTRACTSDADCASSATSLTCLTGCSEYPELAGLCWSQNDAEFLKREVCPAAPAPDGGAPPTPDAPAVTEPDAGSDAGADGPPAPEPDAAPPDMGGAGAAMKFCNLLRRNGQPTELTLEIAGSVRLTAATDACAPMLGQACPAVPSGEVAIRILEGTTPVVMDVTELEAGFEYFIIADLDGDLVFFQTETFETGSRCSSSDPLTMPRRPGPARRSRLFRLRLICVPFTASGAGRSGRESLRSAWAACWSASCRRGAERTRPRRAGPLPASP